MDTQIPTGSNQQPTSLGSSIPGNGMSTSEKRKAGNFNKEAHAALNMSAEHVDVAAQPVQHHQGSHPTVQYPLNDNVVHTPTTGTLQAANKEKSAFDFLLHALEFIKSKLGYSDKNKLTDIPGKISKMPPALQNIGLGSFIRCLTFQKLAIFNEPLTPEEQLKANKLVKAYADGNFVELQKMLPPERSIDEEMTAAPSPEEAVNAKIMAAAFKEIIKHLNLFERKDGSNALVEVSKKYDPEGLSPKAIVRRVSLSSSDKSSEAPEKEVQKLTQKLGEEKARVLLTVLRITQSLGVDLESEKSAPDQLAEVFAPCFVPNLEEGDKRNVIRITTEVFDNRTLLNSSRISLQRMSEDEFKRRLKKLDAAYPNPVPNLNAYDNPISFEKDVSKLVEQFANLVDFQPKPEQYTYEVYNAAIEQIISLRESKKNKQS